MIQWSKWIIGCPLYSTLCCPGSKHVQCLYLCSTSWPTCLRLSDAFYSLCIANVSSTKTNGFGSQPNLCFGSNSLHQSEPRIRRYRNIRSATVSTRRFWCRLLRNHRQRNHKMDLITPDLHQADVKDEVCTHHKFDIIHNSRYAYDQFLLSLCIIDVRRPSQNVGRLLCSRTAALDLRRFLIP